MHYTPIGAGRQILEVAAGNDEILRTGEGA